MRISKFYCCAVCGTHINVNYRCKFGENSYHVCAECAALDRANEKSVKNHIGGLHLKAVGVDFTKRGR